MREKLKQQLEELTERATWHESEANKYAANDDCDFSQGAAQYHFEKAQEAKNQYGRLKAHMETVEKWGADVVLLPGRVMR